MNQLIEFLCVQDIFHPVVIDTIYFLIYIQGHLTERNGNH